MTKARIAVVLAGAVVVASVVRRLRIAAGMRRRDPAVIDAKRVRNKRFANKVVTHLGRAGRPHSVFAIMEVTGRRTGNRYRTPVRAVDQPGDFVIPLTYGTRTSWLVNLGQGPGVLHWQGREVAIGNPVVVPASTVKGLLPLPSRLLLWLDGTDQCVRVEKLGL